MIPDTDRIQTGNFHITMLPQNMVIGLTKTQQNNSKDRHSRSVEEYPAILLKKYYIRFK
jgi:hypothetical protein